MFKRVERKRTKREEEEELGLDEDMREMMGLNDTSDSSESEHESTPSRSSDREQEEDMHSEDELGAEEPPISVAEALEDPIYLIALDPSAVHGCVLCKGKLIKNAGMAAAHRNANVHKQRLEHFKLLAVDADPRSSARELVRSIRSVSNVRKAEPHEPSKRALKRQVRQAAIREKRKRHKEFRAKVITKASKIFLATNETKPAHSSKVTSQSSSVSQVQSGNIRKKQKLESKVATSRSMGDRDVTTKSASRTDISNGGKKSAVKSGLKSKRKNDQPS